MAKNIREKIKLISSYKTGHFYTTTKSKKKKNTKILYKKFDPIIRKHIIYKEYKLQ